MLVRRGATRMFSDGFTDIVWEPRSGEEPVSTGITHEDDRDASTVWCAQPTVRSGGGCGREITMHFHDQRIASCSASW
jgi:hypothetical protein